MDDFDASDADYDGRQDADGTNGGGDDDDSAAADRDALRDDERIQGIDPDVAEEDDDDDDGDEDREARSVRQFCVQWSQLRGALDPLKKEAAALREESNALRANLDLYMKESGVSCALVRVAEDRAFVVRLDPMRPTNSMRNETLQAAIYQHVSVDLAADCALDIRERLAKQADKATKARTAALKRAAREEAARSRPAKRRRPAGPSEVKDEPRAPTVPPGESHAESDSCAAEDSQGSPTLVHVLGELLVEATRTAQRQATAGRTTLSIKPHVDAPDGGARPRARGRSRSSDPMGRDDVNDNDDDETADDRGESAEAPAMHTDIPPDVIEWVARLGDLDSATVALRERMRPLQSQL
ncbi:MAG TPA: hypothetical protein VIO38_17295, partial [Rariglobus sp.]